MTVKRLILLIWFPAALFVLVANLAMLFYYGEHQQLALKLDANPPNDTNFRLTASGGTSQILNTTVIAGDARSLLVEAFLKRYNSPMAAYANQIVSEADRFGIDYTLVPAIAMCESNAGLHMPKKNEYNFAGIAVFTGKKQGKAFTSWDHAISWVSEYIKEYYYDKGITNLRDIGSIWAPPSAQNNYSWTSCVQSFQNQII